MLKCGHEGVGVCSEDPICNEPCTKTLRECGHQCEETCGKPCTKICTKKCSRLLPCGHDCTKKCFEECGPCTKLVDQDCSTCTKKALTGQVKCRGDGAAPVPFNNCLRPCKETLECGHNCAGNCRECFGGLFHKPCQKICDQTKVCGHICKDKCHKECPPCEEKCTKRCPHSTCDHPCFEMCIPCTEPCSEPGCRKLCSSNCDHTLAEPKRCKATRSCGHQCELIEHDRSFDWLHKPSQCAKCYPAIDKRFFSIIMNEEAYDDGELYVYLPDCQHRIEVNGLDYHMNLKAEDFKGGEFKGSVKIN